MSDELKQVMVNQLAKHASMLADKAKEMAMSLQLEFEAKVPPPFSCSKTNAYHSSLQNQKLKRAWEDREKEFRLLWDEREKDFNQMMSQVGKVTKVKLTREVRTRVVDREKDLSFQKVEREATLEDFPEMLAV